MKKPVKIILFIIIVVAVAGAAAGIWLFNKKPADLKKTKPDMFVTATILQKEFEENESEASVKYVSKILEVTGIIASVKRDGEGLPTITLKTDSDFSSIICTLNSSQDTDVLTPGNEVTIRGECSGFLMDVLLNNCAVIEK